MTWPCFQKHSLSWGPLLSKSICWATITLVRLLYQRTTVHILTLHVSYGTVYTVAKQRIYAMPWPTPLQVWESRRISRYNNIVVYSSVLNIVFSPLYEPERRRGAHFLLKSLDEKQVVILVDLRHFLKVAPLLKLIFFSAEKLGVS